MYNKIYLKNNRKTYKRLYSFLNLNNVLSVSVDQFGFQKGLNKSDALADFADIVYSSLNKNNTLIAVHLDFSRSFDTVDIDIILKSLIIQYHLNIGVGVLPWYSVVHSLY